MLVAVSSSSCKVPSRVACAFWWVLVAVDERLFVMGTAWWWNVMGTAWWLSVLWVGELDGWASEAGFVAGCSCTWGVFGVGVFRLRRAPAVPAVSRGLA